MSVWTKHVPIVAWLLCVGLLSTSETRSWVRTKRHTPYMPVDHWQGAPEFGYTESNLTVAVNATAELKCPIGKVQDDAVSTGKPCQRPRPSRFSLDHFKRKSSMR